MVRSTQMLAALIFVLLAGRSIPAAHLPWRDYLKRPDSWFATREASQIIENVISHQTNLGDWPKNTDTSSSKYRGERSQLRGTFDNGATIGELRLLARFIRVTLDDKARTSFLRGLDHVLRAQYGNGGWPQTYPPGQGYARYITFNDGTMVNILEFMRDVSESSEFRFVDDSRRKSCHRAFEKGINCILRCQIRNQKGLTVWCAQHDEVSFEPRPARSYELVSLSGAESAGILKLLMSLKSPSPDVQISIRAGVTWYHQARLTGLRQVIVDGNKVIRQDPSAPALWARFYEIETTRPFFSGRDGVKKARLAEIEPERRNGYAWYGNWGESVASEFEKWNRDQVRPGD